MAVDLDLFPGHVPEDGGVGTGGSRISRMERRSIVLIIIVEDKNIPINMHAGTSISTETLMRFIFIVMNLHLLITSDRVY